ncbi:MAG: choice-of-anchor D domain-containing protein [Luteolibacter sp.]
MFEFQDAGKKCSNDRSLRVFSAVGKICKPLLTVFLILGSGVAQAKVVYVKRAVANPGNGTSWSSAYKYLRDALDNSASGDQIYVAKGTYYPDEGKTGDFGDREFSFELTGQKIYGGFAGSETSLGQRNPTANPTILSGEIWDEPGEDDYWSLHVVVLNQSSTLDGLTVEKGHASGADSWAYPRDRFYDEGGGCYVRAGKTLTLNRCTFRGNRALENGGAIMVEDDAGKVVATDCRFENNSIPLYDITLSIAGGGAIKGNVRASNCQFIGNYVTAINVVKTTTSLAKGGAISGNVTADQCKFDGNSAIASGDDSVALGGAISGDVVNLTRCSFSSNSSNATGAPGISSGGAVCGGVVSAANCYFTANAGGTGKIKDDGTGDGGGGAVYVTKGKSILANCVFVKNTSLFRGGAIHGGTTKYSDSLVVSNSTFLDNGVATGSRGAALSCGGVVRILNNIFWYTGPGPGGFEQQNLIDIVLYGVLRNAAVNYPTPATIAPNIVKGGGLPISGSITDFGGDIFLGNLSDTILTGDPLFVNVSDPNGADNVWGTSDDGLHPGPGSPAIITARDPRLPDATNILPKDVLDIDKDGNFAEFLPLDAVGFVRVQQSYVDLGPYEFGNEVQTPEILISITDGAGLSDGASISFGSLPKRSSLKKSFTIRNVGTGVLKNLSFSPSGSSMFTLKKPALTSVNAGSSVNFTVTFKPSDKGKFTGKLLIRSNDADEGSFDLKWSGTGVIKAARLSPSDLATAASSIFPSATSSDLSADAAVTTTTVAADGSKYLVLTVRKSADWSLQSHTVEVSSNLLDWYSGNHHTTTLVNSSTTLSVRDNTPLSQGEKRYIRLK